MLGIRREDKSRWEARAPLAPADVRRLTAAGIRVQVQRSPVRRFADADYQAAGAQLVDALTDCPLVLGVKEIPPAALEPRKAYVFFSHTIKAQRHNMPMLRRLHELGCTLIDYERIVDERGRRLVFFGRYAGLAGMIDTLWSLGQRLEHEGFDTPFRRMRRAWEYRDLAHARAEIAALGRAVREDGLPAALAPLVCGFAGYGHVSLGAQEIYDLLPVREVTPAELPALPADARTCYKVVFREEHMALRRDGAAFDLQDYYTHPEHYAADLFRHVPHLTVLINGIYWEPRYPKFLTRAQFAELYAAAQPRLRVVGDITCDVDGSLACTTRCTAPDAPVYVYDPRTGTTTAGVVGHGPVVLAVDFLPCELPADATTYFSATLSPFVPALARADFDRPLAETVLPPELQRATILLRGQLTPPYAYLAEHLARPENSP